METKLPEIEGDVVARIFARVTIDWIKEHPTARTEAGKVYYMLSEAELDNIGRMIRREIKE